MSRVGATRPALLWSALLVFVAVLGIALLELGSRAYLWARPSPLLEDLGGEMAVEAPDPVGGGPRLLQNAVLHPYLGYSHRRGSASHFIQERDDYPRRDPGRYQVAVLGGSVATQIVGSGRHGLQGALAALSAMAGRRVQLTSLATGGYKQPQQLLALVYALSKGAEFDLVVNLDGFNDVALPVVENLPAGVHPAYPRSWQLLASTRFPPEELLVAGEIALLDRRREGIRDVLQRSALGGSGFVRLLALQGLRHDATRRVELERRLEATAARRAHAARTGALGAPVEYRGMEDLLPDLVAFWKHTSLLLHQLCTARGMDYLHLLQPNQYDAGSKPLSPEERRSFVNPKSRMGHAVLAAYPMLRRAGAELVEHGVEFRDTSRLFATHPETLYLDACCHYRRAGVRIVSEHIAAEVEALLESRSTRRRLPGGGWDGFRAVARGAGG